MLKAFKVRLYPNNTQAAYFAQAIGCCRAIYNLMLHDNKQAYQQFKDVEKDMSDEEKKAHKFSHKNNYSIYSKRPETSYLANVEARALNYVQQNLDDAFKKAFTKGKGLPVFKKKEIAGSFQSDKIKVVGRRLKVPKCPGLVQFRNYEDVDFSQYKTKTITISRTSNFKYYASILCEGCEDEILPKTGKTIGIDLGVSTAITLDDGRKIDRKSVLSKKKFFKGKDHGEPDDIKAIREQIAEYQRRLARTGVWAERTFTGKDGKEHVKRVLVEKTGNYRRYEAKIAALTEKLVNKRSNYINDAARAIINEADCICMEDLSIANEHDSGMLADDNTKTNRQNATSHRNIAEASMGMLGTKIKTMAAMHGRTVVEVNPAYTSRTCSKCGCIRDKLVTSIREWTCPNCGAHHDRDVNAAENILQRGLEELQKITIFEK